MADNVAEVADNHGRSFAKTKTRFVRALVRKDIPDGGDDKARLSIGFVGPRCADPKPTLEPTRLVSRGGRWTTTGFWNGRQEHILRLEYTKKSKCAGLQRRQYDLAASAEPVGVVPDMAA